MQGRIVWFCLDTGDGIISTDAGQELPFRLTTDQLDLQGGDLVSFDAVEKWPSAPATTAKSRVSALSTVAKTTSSSKPRLAENATTLIS